MELSQMNSGIMPGEDENYDRRFKNIKQKKTMECTENERKFLDLLRGVMSLKWGDIRIFGKNGRFMICDDFPGVDLEELVDKNEAER